MKRTHINKPLTEEELKRYLMEAEYERKLDEAIRITLENTKCVPYCLNGNYRRK